MMRPSTHKKQEKRKSLRKRHTGLGDSDTSMEDESSIQDDDDENAESFRSPPADNNATDYGLEFTASRIQLEDSPRRCSTLRKPTADQRRTARQETATEEADSDEDENVENNSRRANTSHLAKKSTSRKQGNIPTANSKTQHRRKQIAPRRKQQLFERDVLRLQQGTKFLVPRLPFSRLVRELMQATSLNVDRITVTALEALQTASEMYLTQRMQDAYLLTLHRGRVTLEVRDMMLINFLRTQGE